MKPSFPVIAVLAAAFGIAVLAGGTAYAGWPGDSAKCKPDAVKAGSVCMDKYEASVWQIPATNLAGKSNKGLITKIQNGDGDAGQSHGRRGDADQRGVVDFLLLAGISRDFSGQRPVDGATVRRVHCGRAPDGVRDVVPGAAGVLQLAQAAAEQRRVAGGGGRNARSRTGQRHDGLQHGLRLRRSQHRLAQRLRLELRRLRHGGQRLGVGGGLGAGVDDVWHLGWQRRLPVLGWSRHYW